MIYIYIYIYIYTSDQECFNNAKGIYQKAFNKSGYKYNFAYNEPCNETPCTQRNRPRNSIWYNPPYSKNVETNIGKCFLLLIDFHFPKFNPLHRIFNQNTIKLSFSCMPNIKTIITNHNKAEISKSAQDESKENCNCWNQNACLMDGYYNGQNIIY